MKKDVFLAHRSQDGREQTVLAHLTGTAELCAQFASAFDAEAQGRLAGLAHDIGKYSAAFQRRLEGSSATVDHATAGAYECARRNQLFAAFAVAGHHSGLLDGGAQTDAPGRATFFSRINGALRGALEPYDAWESEVTLPPAAMPANLATQAERMFFIRMLYSCLVDADFLDTETFMEGAPADRGGEPIAALEEKLLAHIRRWFPPKTPLDEQRCAILKQCMNQGRAAPPGLFTLTVPTGGGKTVASLAFALCHARAHGLRRVIYVLPYTSIIEQNARVFRDILGEENVLEHHSGVLYDIDGQADPHTVRMAKATENWDMPVVVTTAVQFFDSLFACRSSQCRKLHNLAGSVVIFDEAQMLPVPYLRPCVYSIAQLLKRFRVSAVLCTATQPALGPLFREFLPETPPVELCPEGLYRREFFCRTTFLRESALSWEALAHRMNACPQALCIVNSRRSAQTVWAMLEGEGNFHLSTLLCPAHRRALLRTVRDRLAAGLPCRVVSTSLIEAGVDVDFPAVFREEAGLDSILQAAGRCNREGKRPAEASVVTIFGAECAPPALLQSAVDAGRQALRRFDRPDDPAAIALYFKELLALKGELDRERILTRMDDPLAFVPFRTVAERFHLMEDDTRTVYIPWEAGAALVARLRQGERSRRLFRELGAYGVGVYPNHFRKLEDLGALALLEDGSAILTDISLYSQDTGLALEPEGGRGIYL